MSVYKITLLHTHTHSFQGCYIQARDVWVGALHPDYTCTVEPVDRLPPNEHISDRKSLQRLTQGCADLAIDWTDEAFPAFPAGNVLGEPPFQYGAM